MALYDVTFEVILRIDDPSNGIKLNQDISKMGEELMKQIRKKHPNCAVLPRGFNIVVG